MVMDGIIHISQVAILVLITMFWIVVFSDLRAMNKAIKTKRLNDVSYRKK